MTEHPSKVLDWLKSQETAILDLIKDIVNIDSNSKNKEDVINVFVRLESFFLEHGIAVTWHEHDGIKNAISVLIPGTQANLKPVMLMGHCDTVYPKGESLKRPFTIVDGRAYGPGVADMKAGVAMNAFILAAYNKAGGAKQPLIGLFTNDEEVGSPTSRHIIEHFASKAAVVFNAEPGRPNGDVVTGRKGGVFFEMEVFGKAAHSGANFQDGASAIAEMGHKILALHELTDMDRGVTVNVGLVSGGQSVNTVAPYAKCGIDLRIFNLEERNRVVAQIESIVARTTVPNTTAALKIVGEFRPFVKTPASESLYQLYRTAMQELGQNVDEQFSGGCADSGITSGLGCITLCGTGPVGGRPHTKEEYTELHSIVPRAQGVALSISRLEAF